MSSGPAVEGRPDCAPIEIQLGIFKPGLRLTNVGLRLLNARLRLVARSEPTDDLECANGAGVLLLYGQGDVVLGLRFHQGGLGQFQSRHGLFERGLGLVEGRLIRTVVKLEERFVFLDSVAVLEEDIRQVPGDAGLEIHALNRLGPGRKNLVITNGALNRQGYFDEGRRRGRDLRMLCISGRRS